MQIVLVLVELEVNALGCELIVDEVEQGEEARVGRFVDGLGAAVNGRARV